MQWFTTTPPKDGAPFLARIKESSEVYYYVVYYDTDYNPNEEYVEYCGEHYSSWSEDEIVAWTTFTELNKDFSRSEKSETPRYRRIWF